MFLISERQRGRALIQPALAALACAATLLVPAFARADDLVAATLPSSRSAEIGETVTAFATVINASDQAFTGCTVSLTGAPVTLAYTATNPATNEPIGPSNTPFSLAVGASQTMILALTPSAALAPTQLPLVFGCNGAEPAASLPGLNTVLLSAEAAQPPDVVALALTASEDGVLRLPGVDQPGAFVVATFNVGSDATITVSANTGIATLPVTLTICQTNPTTGACLSAPAASVTLDIPQGGTPTFGIFADTSAPVPFSPATTRVFVTFEDASDVERGATSVALTNAATVASAPTGGGIYIGAIQVASGPAIGQTLPAVFIATETGALVGAVAQSFTSPVTALFTGTLAANTSLGFTVTGSLIATPTFTLPDGATTSPLTIAGALSPQSYVVGEFSATDEVGILAAAYDAKLYQRAVSLALFEGNWNLRDATSVTGTFQVQANGAFTGIGTGTNNAGCLYSGQISIPDPNFNAEALTMTITSCSLAGSYTGLGALYDFLSTDDTVLTGLSSGTMASASRLTRF
jgi:hypothetical protein